MSRTIAQSSSAMSIGGTLMTLAVPQDGRGARTGFVEKGGNAGDAVQGDLFVIAMTGAGPHVVERLPASPVPLQRVLLIAETDDVGEIHAVDQARRLRVRGQVATQKPVADVVGELEPLHQAVADQRLGWVPLIRGDTFLKPLDGAYLW